MTESEVMDIPSQNIVSLKCLKVSGCYTKDYHRVKHFSVRDDGGDIENLQCNGDTGLSCTVMYDLLQILIVYLANRSWDIYMYFNSGGV